MTCVFQAVVVVLGAGVPALQQLLRTSPVLAAAGNLRTQVYRSSFLYQWCASGRCSSGGYMRAFQQTFVHFSR
jgi:hypothetical protein